MRRGMIPYTEYENMMEEKDGKIQDLEEKIEGLKEDLRVEIGRTELLKKLQRLIEMMQRGPERESPPDREIRHPLTAEDRRKEVFAMLMVCSNELENKTLFPSLDQTEVALIVKSGSSEIIIKNASFLIQRIIETLEANK